MKPAIIFIIAAFICTVTRAADTVIIHKDPRLDIFTAKQSEVNKRTARMTSNGMYHGYRLQVLSTRSREAAFKLKSQLLQMFPGQQTYILYQSPYFKVRIGNFTNKSAAADFKEQLFKKYPQTAYIVEDLIEYTPAEDETPPTN